MVWRRPCRVPLVTWLNVLQYTLIAATLLSTSLLRADVQGVTGAVFAGLALGLSCVTILKTTAAVAAQLWESSRVLSDEQQQNGDCLTSCRKGTALSLRKLMSNADNRDQVSFPSSNIHDASLTSSGWSGAAPEAVEARRCVDPLSYEQTESLVMLLNLCCGAQQPHGEEGRVQMWHANVEPSSCPKATNLRDPSTRLVGSERSEYAAQRRAQARQQHSVSFRAMNSLL
jgi:hypothetical protein